MKTGRGISAGMAALALTGCGINQLRIQGATDVTAASTAVVAQANAVLDQAKARREQAYETLIASDPSCAPGQPLYVFVPQNPPTSGASIPMLCASGPDAKMAGYEPRLWHAPTYGTEELKPIVTLIAALGDYEAVLAKVVAKPKPDIAKELQGISDKANDARTLAQLLTGSTLPAIPDLASKQVKAATDILQFVAELVAENEQARDLRKIVAGQHDRVALVRSSLGVQLDEWQSVASKGYAEVVSSNLRDAYLAGRASMDFSARLELLKALTQANNDLASIPRATSAMKQAMAKFDGADDTLASRLSGHPSNADRKQAAELSRRQILEGLHLIANAVVAWGMV